MSDIEYFEATMRDVEAIGRFNNITNSDLYQHEYWTRLPGRSVLMAARDEEDIIGTQSLVAYYLNINGSKMLTGRSERTLVDPKFRGTDVWRNLMENCIERGANRGYQFFWGASTPAIKAFKRLGFLHIHGHRQRLLSVVSLSRVIRLMCSSARPVPLNPIRAYQIVRSGDSNKKLQYARLLTSIYSSLFNVMPIQMFKTGYRNQFELVNSPKSYEDIHNLYQEIRGDKCDLIWLHQDEEFCDWLFHLGCNPVKQWFAYEKGKLRAYLYAIFKNSVASIIDFAAADSNAFKYLLASFRRSCIQEGQIFIETTVNPKCQQQKIPVKCFKRNGFLAVYTGGTTVVRPGQYKDMNILNDPKCYYLTDLWSLLYNSQDQRN